MIVNLICRFKNKDDDFIIIHFQVHFKLHAFLIKSFRALLILPTGRNFMIQHYDKSSSACID